MSGPSGNAQSAAVSDLGDVVAWARALIAIDTVSDRSNLELLEQVERWLRASSSHWCFERRHYTGRSGAPQANLIATLPGRCEEPGLVLAGHADTVPWRTGTRATLEAVQEGGKLWGRGACDMKGAIAAIALAAARAASAARPLARPLSVLVTAEEEIGCLGAKRLLSEGGLTGRMALIGEPTSLRPVRMHKGYLGAEVECVGRACHSSRPALGQNALYPAARAALALEALARVLEAEGLEAAPLAGDAALWDPPYASMNVSCFHAGVARNVVPDRGRFTVELRPLPGQDLAALERRVEQAVREHAGLDREAIAIRWVTEDPPMHTPAQSEACRLMERMTGHAAGAVCFSTEGKELNALGIPTLICGPGTIDLAHTDAEHVELDELERAFELYGEVIEAVCR